jgi:ATP-dependent Lon protease
MRNDDQFDFEQFPDLFSSAAPFDDNMFISRSKADKHGVINCPFLPLRDLVLFPQMVMPLFVGRDRSLAAIQAAMANGENLVVAVQRNSEMTDPTAEDIYRIGTEVGVGRALRMPDNSASVLAQGRARVEILEFVQWEPYIRVRARIIAEPQEWQETTEALMRAVMALFEKVVDLDRRLPEDAYAFAINIDEPGWLADFIASALDVSLSARQDILETIDPSRPPAKSERHFSPRIGRVGNGGSNPLQSSARGGSLPAGTFPARADARHSGGIGRGGCLRPGNDRTARSV